MSRQIVTHQNPECASANAKKLMVAYCSIPLCLDATARVTHPDFTANQLRARSNVAKNEAHVANANTLSRDRTAGPSLPSPQIRKRQEKADKASGKTGTTRSNRTEFELSPELARRLLLGSLVKLKRYRETKI